MKEIALKIRLEKTLAVIRKKIAWKPEAAIILGTGLGNLSRRVKKEASFPYRKLPNFPESTVESHQGEFIFGTLAGRRVAVMQGRFHAYEGYTLQEVSYPVRVLREMETPVLIITNAAGGLNPDYKKGELVLIEDHINFMGLNPLIGPHDPRFGPRFPDLSEPYSRRLLQITEKAGAKLKMKLRRGVYISVLGPNLETRAEYRMMRAWGADLVGMSTVPEAIAAVQAGMEVLGIACVTDVCDPDDLEPVNIQEIIKTANQAGPQMDRLIEKILGSVLET